MPGYGYRIGDDIVVTHLDVMSYMGRSHYDIVVSYASHSTTPRGSSTDRNVFANNVIITDYDGAFFPAELQILRDCSNDCSRFNLIILTYFCPGFYRCMRANDCPLSNADITFNN
ncbi:Uncharacterised protein [Legionella pneumophila]|nr:Uncharacterised protein [Legionella pneumophila]